MLFMKSCAAQPIGCLDHGLIACYERGKVSWIVIIHLTLYKSCKQIVVGSVCDAAILL